MLNDNSFLVSWEKARSNVFRLQRRIAKSIYVGDVFCALRLQKLLILSNSARLVAIRFVTQMSIGKNLSGLDNDISLTVLEKFKLSNFLLENVNNWKPNKYKLVSISYDQGFRSSNIKLWSVSDRCWQYLIRLAIEPAHLALFSPRNFNFSCSSWVYRMQKAVLLNIFRESYGRQKRVLVMQFSCDLSQFDNLILLRKILVPRSIKLGIFRFFKLGLHLNLDFKFRDINLLESLLANVLLSDIDFITNSVRVGSSMLIFLKPNDDEKLIIDKIFDFFASIGLSKDILVSFDLSSPHSGFEFLDWHFQLYLSGATACTPSINSYRSFLVRIKRIINNSNYGAKSKLSKVLPIIREWRSYNKLCNFDSSRFSLFFLRKKAFKSFLKESKQDLYSSKILLDKGFSLVNDKYNSDLLYYHSHLVFCNEFVEENFNTKLFFCIHCGMNADPFSFCIL